MSKAGKPSRPYRGGHTGRGGSHEKGGCLAGLAVGLLLAAGIVSSAAAAWGVLA